MPHSARIHSNLHAFTLPASVEDSMVRRIFEASRLSLDPEGFLSEIFRRYAVHEAHTHNLVTTAGLGALAYNCTGAGQADGDVLAHWLVGTGTTAAALSDTALAAQTASLEDFWQVITRGVHVVGYHLTGAKRNARDGEAINELGLKTNNSGSGKGSDNKLFARAVLYAGDRRTIDLETTVVYLWSFVYRWAQTDGKGFDWGLDYFPSRIKDLSTYGAVSHIAVGTGTTLQEKEAAALTTEATPRQAFTFTSSGATLTGSGTINATTVGGVLAEIGPAVGSSGQVLFQSITSGTSDNDANNTSVSCTITFANVLTADALLLESLDGLLLESGDALLIES